jgi:hypothetical protein
MADAEAPAATVGPPPTVDSQDPLPESNWFWRRVFTFAIITIIVIGEWIMVQTMVNLASNQPALIVAAFVKIIGWNSLISWFAMTYYIIAPSGEQVVKMANLASMLKGGVSWASTSTAQAPDGSAAVTQTKAQGAGPDAVIPSQTGKSVMGELLDVVNQSPLIANLPWNKGK